MNSIQMQAIISPTRELTIKLPAEMFPGTPVLVLITPLLTDNAIKLSPMDRVRPTHHSVTMRLSERCVGRTRP